MLYDSRIAPKQPNEAIANTIAPVTISTIGGPSKSLVTKWLKSETSAKTTAPAMIIPRPDI